MKREKDPLFIFLFIFYLVATVATCGILLLFKYIFRYIKRFYIGYLAKNKKEKLLRCDIKKIDKMDGRSFEEYLKVLFEALGYKAETTKATGDYGADLILKKRFKAIVVQAKCYAKNVPIKAVQEAHSAKAYYNADEAWVVTNSNCTAPAHKLADNLGVYILERDTLIDLAKRAGRN